MVLFTFDEKVLFCCNVLVLLMFADKLLWFTDAPGDFADYLTTAIFVGFYKSADPRI